MVFKRTNTGMLQSYDHEKSIEKGNLEKKFFFCDFRYSCVHGGHECRGDF